MSSDNRSIPRRQAPRRQAPAKKSSPFKKIIWILVLLCLIVGGGAGCGFLSATMQTLPSVEQVKPAASSQIFDVHGNLLTTLHATENRLPVPISDIPKNLQNAFVATEDNRFFSHQGVDPVGIARAIFVNIMREGVSEGGSTITQQLARNAFLTQEQTLDRKIREALLAIKIEQHYTKQEILEMYMNQIYFGQGAYGVQTASSIYFGKPVSELSLAQCALLAGLPQSPNYYSPFNNLEAAKNRQAVVLGQMVKYGYIDQATADEAKNEDLELQSGIDSPVYTDTNAGYFIDYVISLVSEKYGDDVVYKEGLKIYTTIDMEAQNAAVSAMRNLPDFYTDQNGLQQPQGALVAINPQNGYIVAMVGGRGTDSFNRAVMAERQPGSAFKPFVYLAALLQGMTPGTVMEDKEITYENGWSPKNYDRRYSGQVTLRNALTHSLNVIAVKLADEVGMRNVLSLAREMGVHSLVTEGSPNDVNLAAALGGLTHGVTPLDMAAAYSVLANEGIRVTPTAITKIVDRNGQVIEEYQADEKRIVPAKEAYILTNMLESVISMGTGGNASIGRPAAGKTGTTDESKDAWFVGYTPELSTAVWIGDDFGSETLHGITGGTTPAYIWSDFMYNALLSTPASDFNVPAGAATLAAQGYNNPAPPPEKKTDDKDKDKKDEKNDASDDKKTDTADDGKASDSGAKSTDAAATKSDDKKR